MNKHFKNKIDKIRNEFHNGSIDSIEILGKLIDKPKTTFEIPTIQYEEAYKIIIITKMKLSMLSEMDDITTKIIKMIPKVTAMYMTHLINAVVISSKYPRKLKISRILPILKPGKVNNNPDGYRPISNLSVIDKIIQEWIKTNMQRYFEDNKILINKHHRGCEDYSTNTAKALIDYHIEKGMEKCPISMLISTDMSAAFGTVDHCIPLRKLKFYGVRNRSLNLFKSFLSDRINYIELEGFNSEPIPADPCSVIQGSKLSGLLFLIYVNEVPNIHKLIEDKNLMRNMIGETIEPKGNIEHETENFVDDSASVVSFDDEEDAQPYAEIFIKLLVKFYSINRLKINKLSSTSLTML